MAGDGDGVQVSVGCSWNVLQGSLDSRVTVVFLDPHTHEPTISASPRASGKLLLVPPADPVPCEITVKFQGRLCHVESFYSLSTARICELYSHSKHEADPDYICTVKGWVPYEGRDFSDGSNEIVSEGADVMHSNVMQEVGLTKDSMGEGVMPSGGSPIDVASGAVDVDAHKSVYSSGDDSWVDLKSNGSFVADTDLSAPELDNWHVPLNEDELAHLNDQLAQGGGGSASDDKDMKENDDSGCLEGKVQHIVWHDTHPDLFEAELELVDQSPWAALTIRLLSLQDKSVVEVDEMVFLAVSGPVQEPVSTPCPPSENRVTPLLAMFLPNMLQMARGIPGNSKDLPKCENQGGESRDQAEDEMVDNLGAEDSSQSCDMPQDKVSSDRKQIDMAFLQNAGPKEEVPEKQGVQDVATKYGSSASENSRNSCKLEGDFVAKDLMVALAAFSERFDRLESCCLRMEAYMHSTFESLDQRLTHLEAQNWKGSAEAECVSASLKHASAPTNASFMQIHQAYQESQPSSMQSDAPTDTAAISDCKEGGVLPPSAESGESGCSDEQDMVKEVASPTHVVNSVATETPVKEAPSESQERSRAGAAMVGVTTVGSKRPVTSLDDAWASAFSAFASSFGRVREADAGNTVTDRVDEHLSMSMSQHCETLRQESDALSAYTRTDDADSEGDGDEPSPTVRASPIDAPLPSKHLNWFSDSMDLLGLMEMQSTWSKVRTVVSSEHEDMDLAPSQDVPWTGPRFDLCSSADAGSMVEEDLVALMGFNAAASPGFDPTSPPKHYAHYLTQNGKETRVNSHNICSLKNHVQQSRNAMDFSVCEERKPWSFFDEGRTATASGVQSRYLHHLLHKPSSAEAQFRPIFSSSSAAPQPAENTDEILCANRVPLWVDLPDDPILTKHRRVVQDINELHEAISMSSTPPMSCEAEADSTVLDEDGSNYQDGDGSLCFSQDFDACQNDLCEEWSSCAPNVFDLNGHEFADDYGVDGKPGIGDVPDGGSTGGDPPFWTALRGTRTERGRRQQLTIVFPGFEDVS